MIDIKIFGHKNPDTDSILSAIIFADYLNKKGYNATSYKLGELNNETKYLLELFGEKNPATISSLPEGTLIGIVDHNEKTQSINNLEQLKIEFIIDHHKLDFSYSDPINIRMEKVGSTASVLYKMYKEANFEITPRIAKLILSAILSDTLMFKSATTTKYDIEISKELQIISKIENLNEFAMKMFDAKSDLGDISAEGIIKYDYKEFDFSGVKAGIGTLETTNPNYALGRKEELLITMKQIKEKDGLDFILFSIVDIIGENNKSLVINGKDSEIIEKVFDVKIENNIADLKNRLSRKKQIIPDLVSFFEKK